MSNTSRGHRRKGRQCKFPSCESAYYYYLQNNEITNLKFHRFPRDPESLRRWKNACNISETTDCLHFYICEKHFQLSDFVSASVQRLNYLATPKSHLTLPVRFTASLLTSTRPSFDHTYSQPPIAAENSISQAQTDLSISIPTSIATSSCSIPSVSLPSCSNHQERTDPVFSSPSVQNPTIQQNNCSDHDYFENKDKEKPAVDHSDKYAFLTEKKDGFLSKLGLLKKDLTPRELQMYKIHCRVRSKVSKLKKQLKNERANLAALKNLYNDQRFEYMEENLNDVTKNFINAQLRNVNRHPSGRRWTIQDKAFALSMYEKSPDMYKYMQEYFQLPSIHSLKEPVLKTSFNGEMQPDLENVNLEVDGMEGLQVAVS